MSKLGIKEIYSRKDLQSLWAFDSGSRQTQRNELLKQQNPDSDNEIEQTLDEAAAYFETKVVS